MEERSPDLLDHVEFDEEGYLIDTYLNSDVALHAFTSIVCPVFRQFPLLEEYMRCVADREKD